MKCTMAKGDVVLIAFPFTDLSGNFLMVPRIR